MLLCLYLFYGRVLLLLCLYLFYGSILLLLCLYLFHGSVLLLLCLYLFHGSVLLLLCLYLFYGSVLLLLCLYRSMAVCYCSSVLSVLWQCVATHLFDIGSMARSMFLVDTHHNLNSEAIHFQPISSILINQYFSSKASHVQFKFIRLVMFS